MGAASRRESGRDGPPTASVKRSYNVDVDVACDDESIPPPDQIRRWVSSTLDIVRPDAAKPVDVSVRIVGRDEIRALNRDYRHRDTATNVLSFPTGDIAGLPESESLMLGDIVVCAPVVAAEAEEQHKSVVDHWAHMLVHGTLHLLGHDHEHDDDAVDMEALEVSILSGFGIADPYTWQTDTIP